MSKSLKFIHLKKPTGIEMTLSQFVFNGELQGYVNFIYRIESTSDNSDLRHQSNR